MKSKYLFLIGSLGGGGAERIFIDTFLASKNICSNIHFISFYKGGKYDDIFIQKGGEFYCHAISNSIASKIINFIYRKIFIYIKLYGYKNIYLLLDDQYNLIPRIYRYKTYVFVMNNVEQCISRSLQYYKNEPSGYIAISSQIYQDLLVSGYKNIKRWNVQVSINDEVCQKINLNGFVVLASLTYQKNHMFIIDAFNNYVMNGGCENLIIVGEGPLYGLIFKYVEKLQLLNRCKFYKFINNFFGVVEGNYGIISASHFEGAPLSLIEASIYGVPILAATNGYDPKEILNDFKGLTVTSFDLDIFSHSLSSYELTIKNKFPPNLSLELGLNQLMKNFYSIDVL